MSYITTLAAIPFISVLTSVFTMATLVAMVGAWMITVYDGLWSKDYSTWDEPTTTTTLEDLVFPEVGHWVEPVLVGTDRHQGQCMLHLIEYQLV